MPRLLFTVSGLLLALLLASACAGSSDASRSLSFDARSDMAIVILATSVNREQQEKVTSGRSLSSFWVEYDPDSMRLVPGGRTFVTTVSASAFSDTPAYLKPTVSVLEVEPGAYALVGAGFPHLMSTFVATKPGQQDDRGRGQSWHFTVDPRVHIDPSATVNRGHYLFSVSPGEILYIGNFEFVKRDYIDSLRSINYAQDPAGARAALADYPDISGIMVTYDFAKPPQTVAR
jgi:hypothetical protein